MINGKGILSGNLSESELESLIYDYERVSSTSEGRSSWSEYMTTVIEYEDGNFYSIDWDRGLTESQPNSFYNQPERVYPVTFVDASREVAYVEEENANLSLSIMKEELDGAKILSDSADGAIENIKNFDVDSVLEFLESVKPALLTEKQGDFIAASESLFKALQEVQREI